MAERPRGTVTFLFTDVEGSTSLLRQLREHYGVVLAEHARLLREAFAAHGGEEVDTQGDAFFYVFPRARDAAAAAADGQRALAAHIWPDGAEFRVRMGMHTGEPVLSDEGRYHGMGVHRTARIMAAGHGGQVLASQATASVLADDELDGITLRDLGEHNLKDLDRAERIFQLQIDGLPGEFGPLKADAPGTAADELVALPTPFYRRPLVIGAFAGVVAAAVAIPIFAFGGGSGGGSLSALSANSVGVVNPATGAIWIGDSAENRVVRLDPKTSGVTQTIGVGSGPGGLAFGGGAVWVANTLDGTVSRIDPATNQVRATVPVGASPNAIAASDDAVWVANEAGRTIVRLDPLTGSVVRTVRTGARPTGLTLAGSLWVAGQASVGAHRGGTLVFADRLVEKEIDPSTAYTWGLLSITNDGLVGFKRVGGSEGTQLVPNLATSLPAPTDAGKTYAFQLRKGIRFSNGSLLKASDVRSTFERLFKAGTPRPDYYASIRGGSACSKQPKACDLSDGIVTDDEAGTVTFHLTAPDPEFLYRLPIPFGSILPAGTPLSKNGTRPVPATGPYVIGSATPKRLVLVRNRHFRVWNAIARPDGYVDRIEVSVGSKPNRATTDVARGTVDVASGFLPGFGARLANFETQHPAQVHTTPAPATLFWFLNTRVPPFDHVRARQAVSYALDRAELARIAGGPETPQPTCQLLPPNFRGYRPYCPFTVNASAGGGGLLLIS